MCQACHQPLVYYERESRMACPRASCVLSPLFALRRTQGIAP